MMKTRAVVLQLALFGSACIAHSGWASSSKTAANNDETALSVGEWDGAEIGANLLPHPDPNEEHHEGMIYVGRLDIHGRRVGFDQDNGFRFIFGTGFDDAHKEIEEADLHVHHLTPVHELPHVNRDQLLRERRHKPVSETGPKPFGHVETNELDGGVSPPVVVHVEPFFLDETLVTNKEFGKFTRATFYETEAEKFGWSFVLTSFVDHANTEVEEADPEAPHWAAVTGAYWRRPEGPKSTYKYREDHPVVHVSHRDAAEYCKWAGKRLPGEREWEAAARAGNYGPSNRTLYSWGDDDSWERSYQYTNLWGPGHFPDENDAHDGWRATNPVKHYPPNKLGFYDMTGNVWEWQRGGKHKARIVRGGSFVDSLKGDTNHAATLGARDTAHATTTTSNIGFRCARAPKRRTEFHFVSYDEAQHGQLAIEDEFGRRDMIPQPGWEDQFLRDEDEEDPWLDEDEDMNVDTSPSIKKKKVVKRRERISTEL